MQIYGAFSQTGAPRSRAAGYSIEIIDTVYIVIYNLLINVLSFDRKQIKPVVHLGIYERTARKSPKGT